MRSRTTFWFVLALLGMLWTGLAVADPGSAPSLPIPLASQLPLDEAEAAALDIQQASGATLQQVQQIQKLMQNPKFQMMARELTTPEMLQNSKTLIQHPARKAVITAEILWLIAMILLRAWYSSKRTHWLLALWNRTWLGATYLAVAMFLIPGFFFGRVYSRVVLSMVHIFWKSFS